MGFGACLGPVEPGISKLDSKAAPLPAMLTAVSGMVGNSSLDDALAMAAGKATEAGADKLPHTTDPIIAIAARGGLGVNAGLSLQLVSGEGVTVMSDQDSQFMTNGQLRMHSGQAIGLLGGAIKPGPDGIGLEMVAARDSIDLQAQADVLKVIALYTSLAPANAKS